MGHVKSYVGKYRKIDSQEDSYIEFVSKLPNIPSFEEFKKMNKAEKIAYVRNETINDVLNLKKSN